jgi:WD40 repeat protein
MKSPFKFLDSYTKDDREIFFGRDREIEELYQRVFDSKILLVYGVSGTGKSSLIHCGLANKFIETDWLPLVIRRGGNIIESMAASIKTASITPQQSKLKSPADFKKGVRSLYLDHYKPVFFIFDQFEELFIFGDKEERRQFVHIVKSLIESDLQCRLIFVMREEYMAAVTEFEKFIPTFFANRVRIEKMSHANALEAIKEPCKVFNISLEEAFAEALLERLSPESGDVELTYLQVFLDKIFRLAQSEKKADDTGLSFTLNLLQKTGNVSDLLGSFLDEQISLLEDADSALTVLKSFVSVKGTKQPMKPEEAKEYSRTLGREIKEAVLMDLIQTFVHLRILCDKDQNDRYELRHDALAAKIFEKFTLVEKELLEVRKYVENAYFTFESRGIFLNKDDLDYLAAYENKLILPQNLSDFVNQSRQKLNSQRKALTRITRISAIVFLLILAAIGRNYFGAQKENKAKNLIGSALIKSESNPLKGISIALGLYENYEYSTVLQRIILEDFQSLISVKADTSSPLYLLQQQLKPLILESAVVKTEMSKNRGYIYGWMENQRIFVWNLFTNNISYFKSEGELEHLEISEMDSLLALIYRNSNVIVCDFNGKKRYSFGTTINEVINERLVRFFPSGNNQLVAVKDNGARIYDRNGKVTFELQGHSGRINSVDISPDGRFIVSASSDKNIYIWNFNKQTNQFSIYNSLTGHNDTVWSCAFNKTGKYVITASADSSIRIWDLKGKQINPTFNFGMNYHGGNRYKHNKGEFDEDAVNPELSFYYRKNCNASFSEDELSIIGTGYVSGVDTLKNKKPAYNQVLFYDYYSKFRMFYTPFFYFAHLETDTLVPKIIHCLIVSPAGDAVVVIDSTANKIDLLGRDGLRLITLDGNNAMFSKDGKEIFWVEKNKIYKMPITPNEIKNLLNKYKIPESVKGYEDILRVL